jgi:NAD(P)-dependent dehydrogenase (short-subunit alcohol dehydrogenase family)
MSKVYGADTTTDELLQGIDLRGKRVLVTGISAGLGLETARSLVLRGASVVGTARDLTKARAATERAGLAVGHSAGLEIVELDLASLASVRSCADALIADAHSFDVLIANAGVMAAPFGHTVDGFEMQFGTNHLGHFVLINRLLPLLQPGGRIVILASSSHSVSDVDLDDPNFERTSYDPWLAYGRSKTANILFAVELDRRLRNKGIRATAIHPGGISTELTRHIDDEVIRAQIEMVNAELAAEGLPPFEFKSVEQGAATTIWAGFIAPAELVGGRYCEDCMVTNRVTTDPINSTSGGVRPYALDADNAVSLWIKSQELVGEVFQ